MYKHEIIISSWLSMNMKSQTLLLSGSSFFSFVNFTKSMSLSFVLYNFPILLHEIHLYHIVFHRDQ